MAKDPQMDPQDDQRNRGIWDDSTVSEGYDGLTQANLIHYWALIRDGELSKKSAESLLLEAIRCLRVGIDRYAPMRDFLIDGFTYYLANECSLDQAFGVVPLPGDGRPKIDLERDVVLAMECLRRRYSGESAVDAKAAVADEYAVSASVVRDAVSRQWQEADLRIWIEKYMLGGGWADRESARRERVLARFTKVTKAPPTEDGK